MKIDESKTTDLVMTEATKIMKEHQPDPAKNDEATVSSSESESDDEEETTVNVANLIADNPPKMTPSLNVNDTEGEWTNVRRSRRNRDPP